jgi:hypothetical protein
MSALRRCSATLLQQDFPLPTQECVGRFYPQDLRLRHYFDDEQQERRFEMLSFASFVTDTIDVEQRIVIPAVAAVRRLPIEVDATLQRDLYSCVADEGFHAEQALFYRQALVGLVGPGTWATEVEPRFMQHLDAMVRLHADPERALLEVIHGIVTETRISIELGTFARNSSLCDSVRLLCSSHADDEVFHSRLFQLLAHCLCEQASESLRAQFASGYVASMIHRNVPDRRRIALNFAAATGRSLPDAERIIDATFDENVLLSMAASAALPTLALARRLKLDQYVDLDSAFGVQGSRFRHDGQDALRVA